MVQTARRYVFDGMETLPDALIPFVEKRLRATLTGHWQVEVALKVNGLKPDSRGNPAWDQATLLRAMNRFWQEAFMPPLGRAERSIVNELIEVRNRLSHNAQFSWDDTERALDSMRRLMAAIGAEDCARRIGETRDAVLRSKYADPLSDKRLRALNSHQTALQLSGKFHDDFYDAMEEISEFLDEPDIIHEIYPSTAG